MIKVNERIAKQTAVKLPTIDNVKVVDMLKEQHNNQGLDPYQSNKLREIIESDDEENDKTEYKKVTKQNSEIPRAEPMTIQDPESRKQNRRLTYSSQNPSGMEII